MDIEKRKNDHLIILSEKDYKVLINCLDIASKTKHGEEPSKFEHEVSYVLGQVQCAQKLGTILERIAFQLK